MSVNIYKSKDAKGYVSYTYAIGGFGVPINEDGVPNVLINGIDIPHTFTKFYVVARVDNNASGCKAAEMCGEYVSLKAAMLGWKTLISKSQSNNDAIDHRMFEILEYDINKVYNRTVDQIAYRYTGELKDSVYNEKLWEQYVITPFEESDADEELDESIDDKPKYYILTSGDWHDAEVLAISMDRERLLQVCKNINVEVSRGDDDAIATVREFTELFAEIPNLDECQFFTVSFDTKLKHMSTFLKQRNKLTQHHFTAKSYPVCDITDRRKLHERGLWRTNDVFTVDVIAEDEKKAHSIAKEALTNYLKEESI